MSTPGSPPSTILHLGAQKLERRWAHNCYPNVVNKRVSTRVLMKKYTHPETGNGAG